MCIVWWVFNRCGQEKIQEVKEKAKRVVEWAMTLWDLSGKAYTPSSPKGPKDVNNNAGPFMATFG
jgi:hypothetical protein